MPYIEGAVQAVSSKQNVFQTKHGPAYNLRFKMQNGEWYTLKFCNPEQQPPLHQGMQVGFMFDIEQYQGRQGLIVDNVVNKKALTIQGDGNMYNNNGGGQYQQQNGGQYQQPQQQQNYGQAQQGGYSNNQPYQQPQNGGGQYQQQQQGPQYNWTGKEGVATGMAIPAACRLAKDISEVPALAAQILLIQQQMVQNMQQSQDGGMGYLQQLSGSQQQQQQQQQNSVPQPQMQSANTQSSPQQSQNANVPMQQQQGNGQVDPSSMVPQGFNDAPPQ
jgi:hypothetical protein